MKHNVDQAIRVYILTLTPNPNPLNLRVKMILNISVFLILHYLVLTNLLGSVHFDTFQLPLTQR